MGPTGSGKTPLAEALADELGAQLINADAFQIYRGLDVGTAKPEETDRYELLDIKEPTEEFGVGEFVERAAEILRRLHGEGRGAVVVGGTGLYVRALFESYGDMLPQPDPELRRELVELLEAKGLDELVQRLKAADPEAAARIDLKNPARVRRALEKAIDNRSPLKVDIPNFRKLKLGLLPTRETLLKRLDARLEKMLQNGWVAEVGRLIDEGIPRDAPGLRAIGYRALYDHLRGVMSLEAAKEGIRLETRQYAKRQRTWLRSEPNLTALEGDLTTEHALEAARRAIASQS